MRTAGCGGFCMRRTVLLMALHHVGAGSVNVCAQWALQKGFLWLPLWIALLDM